MVRKYQLFDNGKKDVIVDLDGTIADIKHRLHYVQKEPKDWDGFFSEISKDKPRTEIIEMVKTYADDYNIVLVTGRNEEYRTETEAWLKEHNVPYQMIIMREKDDRRDDDDLKQDILNKYFKKENIYLVLEDRRRVIRMWEKNGINVLNVGGEDNDY